MKTCAFLVTVGALFALQATAEIRTPPIDSVFNPGAQTTLVGVNDPEIGDGSTPDGVSVDQVFQVIPSGDNSPLIPVTVGAKDNEPDVNVGRKMLAGRKMLDNLALTGNGVSAGIDGVGVTTTLAGQGQSGVLEGEPTDSHIQPHQDTTTVTAGGKSITTGAGVNPDQLGGEGSEPLVYTVPGRK